MQSRRPSNETEDEETAMMLKYLGYCSIAAVLAGAVFATSFEPAAADTKKSAQVQTKATTLRVVAPGKGRLVPGHPKFTAIGGSVAAVCCTHWNTSTGGTGCATYPDQCPDNTFTVECGADGCW